MDVMVEFIFLLKIFLMFGWWMGFVVGNEWLVVVFGWVKFYFDYGVFILI